MPQQLAGTSVHMPAIEHLRSGPTSAVSLGGESLVASTPLASAVVSLVTLPPHAGRMQSAKRAIRVIPSVEHDVIRRARVEYSRAMDLAPCPSCRRHVSVREMRCPFCGDALPTLVARRLELPRSSRAAIVAAVLTATGCREKAVEATAEPTVADAGPIDALPPVDTGSLAIDAHVEEDAHAPPPGADIYGGPPPPHPPTMKKKP
jgi:hypothetical protein